MSATRSKNYSLVETWIADTSEHTLEDRYVRTILTGLLVDERRGRPITPASVRVVANAELDTACANPERSECSRLCRASSNVLRQLADKLHEVS